MATLDWHVARVDGATLVHVVVESERRERVCVENEVDGPVWPPRTQGVPVAGWDCDGFEGVVEAGERLVLGYATPGEPVEPPATLASAAPTGDPESSPSATDVVRRLGAAGPPRAAVPDSGAGAGRPEQSTRAVAPPGSGPQTPDSHPPESTGEARGRSRACSENAPAEIARWLAAVESRVERAERLAAAESVTEAREVVSSAGGLPAVRTLDERLALDRRAVVGFAERVGPLADRLTGLEVPVETFERLA